MLEFALPFYNYVLGTEMNKKISAVNSANEAREAALADREHTEMREDSAYQRAVDDMRKAGLNPYTIGANPSPSSASSVNQFAYQSKLEYLGYILSLDKLSDKNVNTANGILGNILGFIKKK